MPLRFRKSVKIAPGVKVNFNKKSTSISVGGKHVGITANSHRGVTGRISAPGTGLTYTTKLTGSSRSSRSSNSRRSSRSYDYSSVDFDFYDSDVLFSSSESASQSGSRPQYPTTPKSPPPAPVKPSDLPTTEYQLRQMARTSIILSIFLAILFFVFWHWVWGLLLAFFVLCSISFIFDAYVHPKETIAKNQQINAQNYAKWKVEYNNWAIQNGRKPFDSPVTSSQPASSAIAKTETTPAPQPQEPKSVYAIVRPISPASSAVSKGTSDSAAAHTEPPKADTSSQSNPFTEKWSADVLTAKDSILRIVQAKTQKFSFYHSSISDFNQAVRLNDVSANQSFTITARSCTCPDFVRRQAPCKHLFYYAMEMDYFPKLGPLLHLSAPEISWLSSLYQTDFQAFLLYLSSHKDTATPALMERTSSIKRFLKAGVLLSSYHDQELLNKYTKAELLDFAALCDLSSKPKSSMKKADLIEWILASAPQVVSLCRKKYVFVHLSPDFASAAALCLDLQSIAKSSKMTLPQVYAYLDLL